MAYTTINKSTANFDTNLYQANGSGKTISGMNFKPDFIWSKNRDNASYIHAVVDSVRGGTKKLFPNANTIETTDSNAVTAFNSDGYTFGSSGSFNYSTENYVNWCWNAGGTAPTKTYKVVVVSDSGNKYRFRNSTDTATFAASAVTLDLQEGGTYTFDVSDSTLNSHPFVIGTAANGTEYSTGVTYKLDGVTKTYSQYTSGFSAATSRQLIITLAASAPALYYWCSAHSGMGGAINTNATHGSSNFDGSIQSLVSENSTAGFSVIKWTGNAVTGATIGHGLGVKPNFIILKNLGPDVASWPVYHSGIGATKYLSLSDTNTENTSNTRWDNEEPGALSFKTGSSGDVKGDSSGEPFVAYCFADKVGYQKCGEYVGNGDANGTFIYTGFKPKLVVYKNVSEADEWFVKDSKRPGHNPTDLMFWSADNAETSLDRMNLLSNGFKTTTTDKGANKSGNKYVYLAIGQSIVGSNNIPATAY